MSPTGVLVRRPSSTCTSIERWTLAVAPLLGSELVASTCSERRPTKPAGAAIDNWSRRQSINETPPADASTSMLRTPSDSSVPTGNPCKVNAKVSLIEAFPGLTDRPGKAMRSSFMPKT